MNDPLTLCLDTVQGAGESQAGGVAAFHIGLTQIGCTRSQSLPALSPPWEFRGLNGALTYHATVCAEQLLWPTVLGTDVHWPSINCHAWCYPACWRFYDKHNSDLLSHRQIGEMIPSTNECYEGNHAGTWESEWWRVYSFQLTRVGCTIVQLTIEQRHTQAAIVFSLSVQYSINYRR